MVSQGTVITLLILSLTLDLPERAQGQFWKHSLSDNENWRREMLANRASGICYRNELVNTLNPDIRQRQISYCCDGYVNVGSSKILRCEPICRGNCEHGVCISPDNCECEPGYFKSTVRVDFCAKHGE